ncbi:hypothetical protein [Tenggerimyces flavus]|uniref:Integral membrane protein n=1 Tax=Tenggerimyces flavus TaxID=1708749 RepID=A0ABV7YKW9_9ACTN|nr:hypothetical protein [Tenggerimyces flavus]MBM7784681.1 FtsH-binding integral membrane protein [Tenggerimyces flavus]
MTSLSRPRLATVLGLVVAALGIVVLMLSGANLPVVPPGLVLLLGVAGVVFFTRARWTPLLAVAIALAELAGVIFSGALANVVDPTAFAAFGATWLRVVGVAITLVAAVVTFTTARPRPVAEPAAA